jgi:iron(II)-dependent oxidoreductase
MTVLEPASTRLQSEILAARIESDRLFQILIDDAIYERPIDARHRVIFYVGHLDGFDAIQICREGLGQSSPNREFDDLFQAGIDPDSNHLPADRASDWPSYQEVEAYVASCRALVDASINQVTEDIAAMALEHRLMHLETLAYMFHNFPFSLKRARAGYRSLKEQIERQGQPARDRGGAWCDVAAGEAVLGRPTGGSFGWDNEYGEVRLQVPAFRVQKDPVSNGDYLRFVEQGARMPHFWTERDGEIFYRGMFEEVPLPLDWPVYVSQSEAEAYAKWLGKAVMSEAQFHRAAHGIETGDGNFDFKRWDPESIYADPAGHSAFGVGQLVGNGWEWTSTPFAPFDGFAPRATYPGYSANFFDNEHYVLKGGSARTAARLLRRSFRNWFRRDYPYMYAKFRCVEN